MREITLRVGKRVVTVEVDCLDPVHFSMTTISVDGKAPHKNYLTTVFHLDVCDAVEAYLKALPKAKAPFLFPWYVICGFSITLLPVAIAMLIFNFIALKG